MVPFSKYPSWCTSRMSPYLDFRWQRKGLCRTSICTSASGTFPPPTDTSREAHMQLSTVSSIAPNAKKRPDQPALKRLLQVLGKQQRQQRRRRSVLYVAVTFHRAVCCRKSDFLVGSLYSPLKKSRAHRSTLNGPIFISAQGFMNFTVMQADCTRIALLNPLWRHSGASEQFLSSCCGDSRRYCSCCFCCVTVGYLNIHPRGGTLLQYWLKQFTVHEYTFTCDITAWHLINTYCILHTQDQKHKYIPDLHTTVYIYIYICT